MTVTVLTRWHGGTRDQFVAAGKKVQPIFKKVNGDFRAGQLYAGPNAGQFVSSIRFSSWETYGSAMAILSEDPAYQKVLAEIMSFSQLADRSVIVGIEL